MVSFWTSDLKCISTVGEKQLCSFKVVSDVTPFSSLSAYMHQKCFHTVINICTMCNDPHQQKSTCIIITIRSTMSWGPGSCLKPVEASCAPLMIERWRENSTTTCYHALQKNLAIMPCKKISQLGDTYTTVYS